MGNILLLAVLILLCRYGMPLLASISLPIAAIGIPYLPWPGRLMANASLRPATMVLCKNGRPARASALSHIVARSRLKVSLRHGILSPGHLMVNVSLLGGMAMYKYGMLLPVGTLPTMATMAVLFTRWPGQPMGNISRGPRVIL